MTYQSTDPFSGERGRAFPVISRTELDKALAQAVIAFATWKQLSYAARAVVVVKAADLMLARSDELARAMTREMGKRLAEALAEVELSARILKSCAKHAERLLAPVTLHPQRGRAHVESSPIGLVFAVQPWNFPVYQLARIAGPHLMAGNVLLVRHATNVPRCALAFETLWTDAGAPPGLYTNLFISHEQSDRLVADSRVNGVTLTGNVAVGRSIASRAGSNLKVSSMELVGSDAFVVLEDADLGNAVKWAVWGRMYNAGQSYGLATRLIVLDSVADEFLAMLKASLSALLPGDPMDAMTTLGPLSTNEGLVKLLCQVNNAVDHGAKVELGGHRTQRSGFFMQPTILTDVSPDNPAFREEFVGPVALFFRVPDEDAAVDLANDSDFGRGGAVFTTDVERGMRVASRIDTGMVFINNIDWMDVDISFGGINGSGYGRELGDMDIQDFVNRKLVREASAVLPS